MGPPETIACLPIFPSHTLKFIKEPLSVFFWTSEISFLYIVFVPSNYCVCAQSLSHVRLFATPWTVNLQGSSTHDIFQTRISQFSRSVVPDSLHPMNPSTQGLPVHHLLLEFTQTHLHQVGDTIQPSHPLSSPSPPAPNPSQHQSLFQCVNSSHEVSKVLEFQLQHQSFQ